MLLRRSILFMAALLVGLCARPVAAAPRTFEQESIPATPRTDRKYPASIEAVRFGFDGYLTSDAWAPVRVYISGNPAINSGAFEGSVSLEFAQDASQSASVTAHVATTPGRVMPTEIIAAIPLATPSVKVALRDAAGRSIDERIYWRAQFGESQLPAEILQNVQLGVVIADKTGAQPSIARALPPPEDIPASDNSYNNQDQAQRIDERLACCIVREEDLPASEFGYAGAAFVAARSDVLGALSLPKSNALASWVRSGGCLVVLAGPEPQTWQPLFWKESPLDIQSPSPVRPDHTWHVTRARSDESSPVTGRPLRLNAPISESGWRIDWALADTAQLDRDPEEGLLAQGPAGFGWIVVVGVDPALLGQTSAELTYYWTQALRRALAEASTRPASRHDYSWIVRGSGSDSSARLAIRNSLDKLADIPALGDGAFIAIVASLLLLAVAIGPFDAIFLKRRNLRAWSWATALGWIALASLLAAAVPPLIRSGSSTSHRLRAIDRIQTLDQSAPTASTALTSLFSNSASSIALFDPGRPNDPPIGWFRGISAAYLDEYGRSQPLSTFETFEAEFRPSSGKPIRINAPRPPYAFSMSQWTLRSFMNEAAPAPTDAPSVRVSNTNGDWTVAITHAGGRFAEGSLRIGNEFRQIDFEHAEKSDSELVAPATTLRNTDKRWNIRLESGTSEYPVPFELNFVPGTLLELPGPRERSRAIDALVASGGWACVYLFERRNQPTLIARAAGSKTDFVATESTVWRILVPLPPEHRLKPQPLPAAELKASKPPRKKSKP